MDCFTSFLRDVKGQRCESSANSKAMSLIQKVQFKLKSLRHTFQSILNPDKFMSCYTVVNCSFVVFFNFWPLLCYSHRWDCLCSDFETCFLSSHNTNFEAKRTNSLKTSFTKISMGSVFRTHIWPKIICSNEVSLVLLKLVLNNFQAKLI